MKSYILFAAVWLVLVFAESYAEIIDGHCSIEMNSAASFQRGTTFALPWEEYELHWEVPCSLCLDSLDLFFLSHDCATSLFYCPCEVLGSARPFYLARKQISTQILESPLATSDTTLFELIDTGTSLFKYDDTACYAPCIGSKTVWENRRRNFGNSYVFQSHWSTQNKPVFVFANVTAISATSCYTPVPLEDPVCGSYIKSLAVRWYLQTDGSTDFSQGDFTENRASPISTSRRLPQRETSALYDVRGRRIAANTRLVHSHLHVVVDRYGCRILP